MSSAATHSQKPSFYPSVDTVGTKPEAHWQLPHRRDFVSGRETRADQKPQHGLFRKDHLAHHKQICWLEDVHIRRYPIPQRQPLRRKDYRSALNAYLRLLNAPPIAYASPKHARNFLLQLAISLHYRDNAARYNTPFDPWQSRCLPVVRGVSSSEQVATALHALAQVLQLPTLDGVSSASVAAAAADAIQVLATEPMPLPPQSVIHKMAIGFDTPDAQLRNVVCAMRLLFVRRLRSLQDDVNTLISGMQSITANPHTDSKLGKVGR